MIAEMIRIGEQVYRESGEDADLHVDVGEDDKITFGN